jgi:hypothetical protein
LGGIVPGLLVIGQPTIHPWIHIFLIIFSPHFLPHFQQCNCATGMSTTQSEILNPAIPGLPPKDVVVRLCKKKGFDFNTLTYSAEGNTFFIKYNNVTMEEAHAQVFFRQKISERNNTTIRIPEVYHAFNVGGGGGRGYTYIVMEHIEIDFERTASDEQRAQAISELISIPPPPGVFGSLTGGMYRHHFFQDSEPPVPFSSASELEDYLNRVGVFLCEWGAHSLG